jgi:hypothetical protein
MAPSSGNSEFSQISSDNQYSQPQTAGRHSYSYSRSDSDSESNDSQSSHTSGSMDGGDNATIHEFDLGLDDMDFLSIHHDSSMPSIRFGDSSQSQSMCMTKSMGRQAREDATPSPNDSKGSLETDKPLLRRIRKRFSGFIHKKRFRIYHILTYFIVFMRTYILHRTPLRGILSH